MEITNQCTTPCHNCPMNPNGRDDVLPDRAVEALVDLGQLVGMSPEDMMAFLQSGKTVFELLDVLESKARAA